MFFFFWLFNIDFGFIYSYKKDSILNVVWQIAIVTIWDLLTTTDQ